MNAMQLYLLLEGMLDRQIMLEEIEILAEVDGYHVVTDFKYQEREGLKELITIAQTRVPFDWRTIRIHSHVGTSNLTTECLHPDCGWVMSYSMERMDRILEICERHPCRKRRDKDGDKEQDPA